MDGMGAGRPPHPALRLRSRPVVQQRSDALGAGVRRRQVERRHPHLVLRQAGRRLTVSASGRLARKKELAKIALGGKSSPSLQA